MTELLERVPFDFVCLAALGALGLRRLVLMERFHWPRVVLLTALLWVPALYLFSLVFPPGHTCTPLDADSDVYTVTEM